MSIDEEYIIVQAGLEEDDDDDEVEGQARNEDSSEEDSGTERSDLIRSRLSFLINHIFVQMIIIYESSNKIYSWLVFCSRGYR